MQERYVDVAIIGAGSAGLSAYRAAKRHTSSVLLIESGPYGTTCARVGCMPSKLLIAAANAIHDARNVGQFGGRINGGIGVDGRAVMERLHRERDRFVASIEQSISGFPDDDKVCGQACFETANTLVVAGYGRVHFERAVIATGSRPNVPESLKAAGERLVTSDTLFDWQALPESVAVFGPGALGLELGQALSRLGVRVRMFGRSGGVGGLSDERVRERAVELFNHEFPLDPSAEVSDIALDEGKVKITFKERGSDKYLAEHFDRLLAATGRRPNLDGLALEKAGLGLDDNGIPCFDRYTLQCQDSQGSACPIFIAGDVNQAEPLLHEATDEGRIAGDNAGRYPNLYAGHRRIPLAIVFSEPQIATLGLKRSELDDRYPEGTGYAVGELDFATQGRAQVMGVNQGLIRLYGEYGTGYLLGAELLAPGAEHLGHLLAWVCQQRLTVPQILKMPFYHPTLEEGLRTALRDLSAQLLLDPRPIDQCTECGPGA